MYVDVHCKHVCFNQNEVFVLISNVNWVKTLMIIILMYVNKPFLVVRNPFSMYALCHIMNNYSLQGLLLSLNLEPFRDRCNVVSNGCWVSFPILRKFCFLLGQFTSFSKLTKINCPTICLYKLSKWLTDSRIAHEYFRQEIEWERK